MSVEAQIASMASAINTQTDKIAKTMARKIRNVWVCEDGRVVTIEDPLMLKARLEDEQKVLDDMLRAIDVLVGERDGHGD